MELNQAEMKLVAETVNDALESWVCPPEETWSLIELGNRILNDRLFEGADIDQLAGITERTRFADDMEVDWSDITDDTLLLVVEYSNVSTIYRVEDFLTAHKVITNGVEFYHLRAINTYNEEPVIIVMDVERYNKTMEDYNEQK